MPDLLSQLAAFARPLRGFLAFAAFALASVIGLFTWLFSRGSFDSIISQFGALTRDQFFLLALLVLGLMFIFTMTLVFLAYRASRGDQPSKSIVVYAVVHDAAEPSVLIENADVTLLLPDPLVKRTQSNGSASFVVPGEYVNRSTTITAKKPGFRPAPPQKRSLKNGLQILIPLEKAPLPDIKEAVVAYIDSVSEFEAIEGNTKTLYTKAGVFQDIDIYGRGARVRVSLSNCIDRPIDVVSVRLKLLEWIDSCPPLLKYEKLSISLPHTRLPVEDVRSTISWLDTDLPATSKEIGDGGRIRLSGRGSETDVHQLSFFVEARASGLWIFTVVVEFVDPNSHDKVAVTARTRFGILLRGR